MEAVKMEAAGTLMPISKTTTQINISNIPITQMQQWNN